VACEQIPGGIDPHTHMEMPFMGEESCDDFFSGQEAALSGGTTMHIDFALPHNGDLAEGFRLWVQKAEKSCMDYGFHMAVTKWNDKVAQDMEWLVKEKGTSFTQMKRTRFPKALLAHSVWWVQTFKGQFYCDIHSLLIVLALSIYKFSGSSYEHIVALFKYSNFCI